jgi:hypothetical protein
MKLYDQIRPATTLGVRSYGKLVGVFTASAYGPYDLSLREEMAFGSHNAVRPNVSRCIRALLLIQAALSSR